MIADLARAVLAQAVRDAVSMSPARAAMAKGWLQSSEMEFWCLCAGVPADTVRRWCDQRGVK